MRFSLIFLALAAIVAIPFLVFGDLVKPELTESWLRDCGSWAWAAGIGLLVGDLFLPIPSTAVMAALGHIYGWILGGTIGAVGSCAAGVVAYVLCLKLGRRAAIFLAGEKDLERGERLFSKVGGWLVALSRWLPVLPEAVTCMAGLVRMPWPSFLLALVCGSFPMAYTFAAVGTLGGKAPIVLSAVLPVLIWPVAHYLLRRKKSTVPG